MLHLRLLYGVEFTNDELKEEEMSSMFEWIAVSGSSRIVAEGYDEETETIYVRFPNGVEWQYSACPRHVWEEFTSPGQSRGSYIKDVLDHKPHGRYAG